MPMQDIAVALQRVESALQRRPQAGLHDDAPAMARWVSGTRIVASHADGTQVLTDMPREIGGNGEHVTPGWLFRAGLASCAATRIAMGAAAAGIEITVLEVRASSRSDTRGLLGMADADGVAVCAGPSEMQMHVRIAAPGVSQERLRALVEHSNRCAPVAAAVQHAVPVALHIDVDTNTNTN